MHLLQYSNNVGKGMINPHMLFFHHAYSKCNICIVCFVAPLKTYGTLYFLWNITENLNKPHRPSEWDATLRVSTFNASLCMHSPAAAMLWMDNGLVKHGWPDSPLPITAQPFRLRSVLQSATSRSPLFNTRKGQEKLQANSWWHLWWTKCKKVSSFASMHRSV